MYKLSRLITPLFIKSYKSLSLEDQRNWDTRWVWGGALAGSSKTLTPEDRHDWGTSGCGGGGGQ